MAEPLTVPVFGFFFRDQGTSEQGTVTLALSHRVNAVDGRRIYPEGAKVVRKVGEVLPADRPLVEQMRAAWRAGDQAAQGSAFVGSAWDAWWKVMLEGIVIAGLPASDSPDIVPGGYQVAVTERMSNSQQTYVVQPQLSDLARTPPGVNLGLVDVAADDPEAQPLYQKGAPGGVAALDADGDVLNAAGDKVGSAADIDLSAYSTTAYVDAAVAGIDIPEPPDLTPYALAADIPEPPNLAPYATNEALAQLVARVAALEALDPLTLTNNGDGTLTLA